MNARLNTARRLIASAARSAEKERERADYLAEGFERQAVVERERATSAAEDAEKLRLAQDALAD